MFELCLFTLGELGLKNKVVLQGEFPKVNVRGEEHLGGCSGASTELGPALRELEPKLGIDYWCANNILIVLFMSTG